MALGLATGFSLQHKTMIHKSKKISKLDINKIKNYSAKDIVKGMKRKATEWEKISAKEISDKGMLFKIYEEHLKVSNKKQSN